MNKYRKMFLPLGWVRRREIGGGVTRDLEPVDLKCCSPAIAQATEGPAVDQAMEPCRKWVLRITT